LGFFAESIDAGGRIKPGEGGRKGSYEAYWTFALGHPFLSEDYLRRCAWRIQPGMARWRRIFHLASINGVEYFLSRNVLQMDRLGGVHSVAKRVRTACEEEIKRYHSTLAVVLEVFDRARIDFLCIKSLAHFDFVRDDVDLLFKDRDRWKQAVNLLLSEGWSVAGIRDAQVHLHKPGFVELDCHWKVKWDAGGAAGIHCAMFDERGFWKRKRRVECGGLTVSVPCPEDDVLILLAHALFQHHYLTIGELVHVGELVRSWPRFDFGHLVRETTPYGWTRWVLAAMGLVQWAYEKTWELEVSWDIGPAGRKGHFRQENSVFFMTFPSLLRLCMAVGNRHRGDPTHTGKMLLNLALSIYRKGRFLLSGRLPFNACFLESLGLCDGTGR